MKRLFIKICSILCIAICLIGCKTQAPVETTSTSAKSIIIPEPIPTLPETTTTQETTTIFLEEFTTIEEFFEEQYEYEQQQWYEEQYYKQEEYYEEENFIEQYEEVEEVVYQNITRETIINYAANVYGVSQEWTIWLIGTTWNEGYQADRYLEYAWACQIINVYSGWSVWDLDCIWGDYYSIDHAYSGYYSADDTTLEMVWQALTDTDTRIVEVDGMIDYYVEGYYLIYDSPFYNCQVWGSY